MSVIKKIDSSQNSEQGTTPVAGPVVKPIDKQAKAEASKQEYLNARKRVKTGIKVGIAIAVVLILVLVGSCSIGKTAQAGQAKVSSSSATLSGKHFEDVQTLLEKDGFTNITLRPEGDLIAGVLHDEGDVETVSIDGQTTFSAGAVFDAGAKVVIAYHSYPEKSTNTAASTNSTAANTAASNSESASSYDSAEFRKSMDSYEAFIDSYVEFMTKYNSDSANAASMAADYAKMLSQYAKAQKDLDKIDEDKLTGEDHSYFAEVVSRCNTKLASVA